MVGRVATLSDGGLPDGGVPERPGRSDAANKGWLTPLETPEFGNEIAYTDLLGVAKMRARYMCAVYARVWARVRLYSGRYATGPISKVKGAPKARA